MKVLPGSSAENIGVTLAAPGVVQLGGENVSRGALNGATLSDAVTAETVSVFRKLQNSCPAGLCRSEPKDFLVRPEKQGKTQLRSGKLPS